MKTLLPSRAARVRANFHLLFLLLAASPLPAARAAEVPGRGIRVEAVKPVANSPREGNAGLWVGVNTFRDESVPPLRFAVNDAVAQAHLFVLQLQLVPARNAVLLLSGEPSTAAARTQLTALRESGVRIAEALRGEVFNELRWVADRAGTTADLLLVSVSSHGFEDGTVPYILPNDGYLRDLDETGLSLKAVETRLEKSKAGTRLLIVDACRERTTSGGKNVGAGTMRAAWRLALEQGYGQASLASCDVGQISYEDVKLGHGVFTYHLLEALNGKAAADGRGFITLGAMSDYVTAAVNDWVLRNRRSADRATAQKPWFKGPNEARQIPLAIKVAGLSVPEDEPPVTGPASATKEKPWVNSLGMKFVPVAGTEVLFSVWETRVQDYAAFASATSRAVEKPTFEQGPTHPVVKVSWDDAQAFGKWLTEKERREGTLTAGQSYRLPQDWEWSVAVGLNEARAGTPRDKDGKIKDVYPWGTQWPPPPGAGNFSDQEAKAKDSGDDYIDGYNDGYAWTSPAGSFAANRFGLFDLSGNAHEWCEDLYDNWRGARVLRGGSWSVNDSEGLLSAYRVYNTAGGRLNNFGFRCVLVGVSSR